MKTGKITINGKEYITCLSTRVLIALEERGGNADKELSRIMKDAKLSDLFWLLAQMIDAGDRYAKLEGIENPGSITLEHLMDAMGPDDYEKLTEAMGATIKAGTTPTVESIPGKKARKNEKASREAG